MSTPAQSGPLSPELQASVASSLDATFYIAIASLVIWFWDLLLNLNVEISVIWLRKGAIAKTLYGVIRYIPALVLVPNVWLYNPIRSQSLSSRICRSPFFFMMFIQGIASMVVTTVFALRVYTLYTNNQTMRTFLVTATAVLHLALLGLGLQTAITISRDVIWYEPLGICLNPNAPLQTFSLYYAATLITETVIAIATLYHAIRFHRQGTGLKGSPPGIVITALHRDGFSYFALIFSSRVVLCTLMWSAPSIIVPVLTYLEFAVMTTMTGRWLLSFRQLAISVWNDSQSTQEGHYLTGASITVPPKSTIESITRSFGFSTWTEPRDIGDPHSLQTLRDSQAHQWPE